MFSRYWITGAGMALIASAALAQDFGVESDEDMAAQLWQRMEEQRLVGEGAIQTLPYAGTEPHGVQLQTFFTTASVGGHAGTLVVKRNHGPAEVTADAVLAKPGEHLAAVTVMFRREAGYAPDNGNWFWAKYLADGSLDLAPDGRPLAGRVTSCIECHASAEGSDHVFTTNAGLD